jgi:O-antigen/teichoic acid export membrane protein
MTAPTPAGFARNTALNLLGAGIPALVAIAVIPTLLHRLGTERFGVLSLLWVLTAYFTLFDFGIGRALTRAVAGCISAGRSEDVRSYAAGGVAFMFITGLVAAVTAFLLAPWLATDALRLPAGLAAESVPAFRLVALALPFTVSAPGLQAVLMGYGRFDVVNALRAPVMSLGFLMPVAALSFSPTLAAVAGATALVQCLGWFASLVACMRVVPALRSWGRPDPRHLRQLLGYGSWLTTSNIIAPLMLYLDRFLIARVASAAAVAYYTTPFSVVTQLWIVPRAVAEAIFPRLSSEFAAGGAGAPETYRHALRVVVSLLAPAVIIIVAGARPALSLWLGPEFAAASFRVAQILAVAVLLNAIGLVATTAIQAAGRPDLTAKLHMAEAPVYFAYLTWLLAHYGIVGAAVAWLIRVGASALVLSILAHRCLRRGTVLPPAAVVQEAVALGAPLGGGMR